MYFLRGQKTVGHGRFCFHAHRTWTHWHKIAIVLLPLTIPEDKANVTRAQLAAWSILAWTK